MELKRGTWYKKYINCFEDKRDYDLLRRGYMRSREALARDYCDRYNVPKLTSKEISDIDNYWGQYGIKLTDYNYHRMYYYVTGKHDVRFIPDNVAGLIIYPYYNDFVYENTWRDKNMFSRLLPDVPFPKIYGQCIRNRCFIDGNYYTREDENFARILYEKIGESTVIVKDTRNTGFGRGVKKYTILCMDDIAKLLNDWGKSENFVVQECIEQHNTLKFFNESSVNMIRVVSWRHDNEVDVLFGVVRAGIEGQITDISFIDGIELARLVGITEDGYFDDKMYDQDGKIVKTFNRKIKVPSWDKIKTIIKKNHLFIDNFDIVGWDFTIDKNENPICFEWNIQWPGTVFYQYVKGPLFGEKTDRILNFLKSEYNRDNYIPCYMKL